MLYVASPGGASKVGSGGEILVFCSQERRKMPFRLRFQDLLWWTLSELIVCREKDAKAEKPFSPKFLHSAEKWGGHGPQNHSISRTLVRAVVRALVVKNYLKVFSHLSLRFITKISSNHILHTKI